MKRKSAYFSNKQKVIIFYLYSELVRKVTLYGKNTKEAQNNESIK